METNYKRTVSGSIGAGISAVFNGSDRRFFILEHKTQSAFHKLGESQKIIVDQVELGRAATCQVRFDESFDTVSRRHAAIVKDGDGWKIINLSQTNHTYVNGAPVTETRLNNGDEIRLSSNGPVLGFIVPQGARSMVNSIGLTERMNLFRQQALRPYKTAIAVLGVLLVLGVGTLSYFNVRTNKALADQIAISSDLQGQLADAAGQMNDIQVEMADKDAEIIKVKEELENNKSMTIEQIADANKKLAVISAEKKKLANQYSDIQKEMQKVSDQLAGMEQTPMTAVPTVADFEIPTSIPEVSSSSKSSKFSDIDECIPAVYHISMDYITVYDQNGGNQLFQLDTKTNIIGGTGFILNNGTFVTARRVVQPWFYYRDTPFGSTPYKGNKSIVWYGWRLFWAWSAGMNVVAHFTAQNSEGHSFQFTSSTVSHYTDLELVKTSDIYARGVKVKSTGDLIVLVNKYETKEYAVSMADKNDWASIAQTAALQFSNGGLVADYVYSTKPQKDNVTILGFPKNEGAGSSFDIKPVEEQNSINTPTLNRNGLIEMSTKRFVPGNDGSPVMVNLDGVWTVVGVLCHSDGDNRDLAVPIASVKRK